MRRLLMVLVVLLSGLGGAGAESYLKKASLPGGGHYYYPAETYFLHYAEANCTFEDHSTAQILCVSRVDNLRIRWEEIDSLVYQIKLNPRIGTPAYVRKIRDAIEVLVIEGENPPDFRLLAEEYHKFGG